VPYVNHMYATAKGGQHIVGTGLQGNTTALLCSSAPHALFYQLSQQRNDDTDWCKAAWGHHWKLKTCSAVSLKHVLLELLHLLYVPLLWHAGEHPKA
jgi:hypothetical protein